MDMLQRMLQLQEQLQVDTYGFNFQRMLPNNRVQYIKDMQQAAIMELGEALNEVDWKTWVPTSRINRDAYVGELVDVLHFIMNMLLALGDTPEDLAQEIFTRYCLKNHINERRQREGYDGVSTKCGHCGRALDDPAVKCKRWGDQGWCATGGIEGVDVNYLSNTVGPEQKISPIKPPRDTVTP